MASNNDPLPMPSCCSPGEFTITKIPTGYLIGRATPRLESGPSWHYIAITESLEEATSAVLQMAKSAGSRAWMHRGGDDYDLLSDAEDTSAPDA